MKRCRYFILTFLFVSFLNLAFANEESVSVQDKFGVTDLFNKLDIASKYTKPLKEKMKKEKIDFDMSLSLLQGADNNAFLNSLRKKDAFLQDTFSADMIYRHTDNVRAFLGGDITNILYYKFTDNSLLDFEVNPGMEIDCLKDSLTVITDYKFEYLSFYHDEDGSYLSQQGSVFFKNYPCDRFTHKAGFRLEYKDFTHRKALDSDSTKKNAHRQDMRYTGEYEMSFYLTRYLTIKENLQFYRNDSNDRYYDYFDYHAFRTKSSLIALFSDKFYSITSLAYTRKWYDNRLSTGNGEHEKDNLYVFNLNLLYELTPAFTLAGGLSYRENASNEPLEKYSGAIWTVGLYYTF